MRLFLQRGFIDTASHLSKKNEASREIVHIGEEAWFHLQDEREEMACGRRDEVSSVFDLGRGPLRAAPLPLFKAPCEKHFVTQNHTLPPRLSLFDGRERGSGGGEHVRHKGEIGRGDDNDLSCLRSLSDDGNDLVVGVDGRGKVVARSVMTGEPRVLLSTPHTSAATATAASAAAADADGGGATFGTMDYDRKSGIIALATARGAGRVVATSVDLYELCDMC